MLVIELKSEALKDRHWKQLMKRLHVNWVLSELTLGQIWDVDLQKNEMVVKDVLLVAQGEMALEEFLKQVKMRLCCDDICIIASNQIFILIIINLFSVPRSVRFGTRTSLIW